MVLPSLAYTESSFFNAPTHRSLLALAFCNLLRTMSNSLFRELGFSLATSKLCCYYNSSISPRNCFVRPIASWQLSMKPAISSNSPISPSYSRRYCCYNYMLRRCDRFESMVQSWIMLNSRKEESMIPLTSCVTFFSSSISRSNSFSSCYSAGFLLNSTALRSFPPANNW